MGRHRDGRGESHRRNYRPTLLTAGVGVCAVCAALFTANQAIAYERYNSGCQYCHGAFTDGTSPKGTVFPMDSKHEMHRNTAYMATACDLCHRTGDNRNPYLRHSNGTANNPGIGCIGCHGHDYGGTIGPSGAGLRRHHAVNGVTVCGNCHTNDPVPMPEYVKPTYYHTPDTRADDPCNAGPAHLENWSIGDTEGLDNDGNNLYDGADPNCGRVLGDMNCSGRIDFDDIDPFVLALSDRAAYEAQFPNCRWLNGDCNSDGTVNFDDIDPFVALLTG